VDVSSRVVDGWEHDAALPCERALFVAVLRGPVCSIFALLAGASQRSSHAIYWVRVSELRESLSGQRLDRGQRT
jgi:hypothetical protein